MNDYKEKRTEEIKGLIKKYGIKRSQIAKITGLAPGSVNVYCTIGFPRKREDNLIQKLKTYAINLIMDLDKL